MMPSCWMSSGRRCRTRLRLWGGAAAARDDSCRFHGTGCWSGRLTSLSLTGVPLNADFRIVEAILLQLNPSTTSGPYLAVTLEANSCGGRSRAGAVGQLWTR
ncbi:hypothetical protein GUJ93_ZPchr0013g37441 [Zizania palustris]|uniref:Uncharacterized protein n=1 Tax=Zizania palustris TaxID=103762 RepID=A0A8J5WV76_ZIZPA|nr:hypothetical protein GUJ93_ZPchr0013g37441 [Zizania palustris]